MGFIAFVDSFTDSHFNRRSVFYITSDKAFEKITSQTVLFSGSIPLMGTI